MKPEFIEAIRPRAELLIECGDRRFYAAPAEGAAAEAFAKALSATRLALATFSCHDGQTCDLPFTLPPGTAPIKVRPGDLLLIGDSTLLLCKTEGEFAAARLARLGDKGSEIFSLIASGDPILRLSVEWSE